VAASGEIFASAGMGQEEAANVPWWRGKSEGVARMGGVLGGSVHFEKYWM